MLIRKNISLDEQYLKKLQPLLDANDGNLSAAIRDTIELTDTALEYHETIEKSINILKAPAAPSSRFDELIENGEHIIINRTALKWLIKNSGGCLIENELVDELINPFSVQTIMELDTYLNNLSQKFGWGIETSLFCKDPLDPETARIVFSNGDLYLRDFFAEHVVLFIAKWKQLDIDNLYRRSKSIRIDFKKASVAPDKVAPGIKKHFGYLDLVHRELHNKPEFWNEIVNAYNITDYKILFIPKNQFKDIAAGKIPDGIGMFEAVTNQPIKEIPLSELLVLFKKFYSVSQIVNHIIIHLEPYHESVKIQHDYKDDKTISNLIQYFSNIFEANGHTFDVVRSNSLIIFKHYS
ncbi:MAG TPA: hypothetical protein C5S50_02720 [Methanosarcinaceae archaeon]|nr:hypothetical protein [Methanosarcinaceae archaeon]